MSLVVLVPIMPKAPTARTLFIERMKREGRTPPPGRGQEK
jgi:hypothetical protein